MVERQRGWKCVIIGNSMVAVVHNEEAEKCYI